MSDRDLAPARKALAAYRRAATGHEHEPQGASINDLLVDLAHLADELGYDALEEGRGEISDDPPGMEQLDRAFLHYLEETRTRPGTT